MRGGLLAVRPRPAQAAPREGGRAERTAHTHLGAVAARRPRCSRSRGVYSGTGGGRPSFGRRTPLTPFASPSGDPGHLRVLPAGGALRPPRSALVPKAPGDLRQVGSGSRSPHCHRGRRSHMLCIRLHIIHFNVNLRKSPQPLLLLLVRVLLSLLPLSLLPTHFTPLSLKAPRDKSHAFLWLVHLSKLAALPSLPFPMFHSLTRCFFETKERPRVTVCRDKGPELQISRGLDFHLIRHKFACEG